MDALAAHFVSLAQNNHWSNYRLHGACKQLSEQEYFAPRPSFFGSIHAALNHILIVDLLYLGRLTGEPLLKTNADEIEPDLSSLCSRRNDADIVLLRYCEAQNTESLVSTRVSFELSAGEPTREEPIRVLSHLFVHQIHHRGQIHDMLSQTRVPPPQLDEFFLRIDASRRAEEMTVLGLPPD